ncbi:MAG: heme-binding protein [Pseudomonadota bacterium]
MVRSLLAGVAAVLLAGCSVVGVRSGTEQPRFDVVQRLGDDVEIRRYGGLVAAETVVPPGPDARNAAFRRLAGYIFGDNQGDRRIVMTTPVETSDAGSRIAMTAPVGVDDAPDGLRMRFFLPSNLSAATAPVPNDPDVQIVELPPTVLAVLRFTGATGDAAVAAAGQRLLGVLASSPWMPTGELSAFFYDPPWTLPPLRRNEVVVPVERIATNGSSPRG